MLKKMKTEKRASQLIGLLKLLLKRKKGFFGILLLSFFILLSILSPAITFYDPIYDINLAGNFAMPEWMTFLPVYRNLPRNMEVTFKGSDLNIHESEEQIFMCSVDGETLIVHAKGGENFKTYVIELSQSFDYLYDPPKLFTLKLKYNITLSSYPSKYRMSAFLMRMEQGRHFYLYDSGYSLKNETRWDFPLEVSSNAISIREMNNIPPHQTPSEVIFSAPGQYYLNIKIEYCPMNENSEFTISINEVKISVKGMVFGLLGTNYIGSDVWSQFVWGTRVSLIVGLIASTIAVFIGLFLGLISGYKGGVIDQLIMFFVDTVFLIPLLPIILIAIIIIGRNTYLTAVIIGLFLWASFAREIRSWVYSLKERGFVEAARAIGNPEWRIMLFHILPLTAPVVAYAFIIRIPYAILLEAGLSILGFGDPFTPSWGKMINEAWFGGAILAGAWWWLLPPMVGLILISLGFVLLGHAIDEILNPRLKTR